MNTVTYNMTIEQGTNYAVKFIFCDGARNPIDLSSSVFKAQIKRSYQDRCVITAFTTTIGATTTTASATYSNLTFTATTPGTIGNAITLIFDGVSTVQTIVNAWNTANPTNTVEFELTSSTTGKCSKVTPGSEILPAKTVTLTGGNIYYNALLLTLNTTQTAHLPVARFTGPNTPDLTLYWDLLWEMSDNISRPIQGTVSVSPRVTS